MNIIININNLLTAPMLEKYLLRHSLKTRVEAVGPLDPALAGMDVAIYFAENIAAVPLIEFLQKAEGSSPFVKKMLFAKTEEISLIAGEIRSLFDEVVTLPVNAAALVEKLTRLCPHEARSAMAGSPEEPPAATAPPPEESPVKPIITAHSYTLDNLDERPASTLASDPYADLKVPQAPSPPLAETTTILPPFEPLPAALYPSPALAGTDSVAVPAVDANQGVHPLFPAQDAAPPAAREPSRGKTKNGKLKPRGFKRVLAVAGKILTALMLVLVLSMILLIVNSRKNKDSPWMFGYTYYVVYTGSMKGTNPDSFDAGSLIFVKKANPAEIAVGDIITFDRSDKDAKLTTHRVVKITSDAKGKRVFTTKGDANAAPDDAAVPENIVRGVVAKSVPKLGNLILFAQTKTGMLYFVYVPAGAIVLYEVYVFGGDYFRRKKTKGSPDG